MMISLNKLFRPLSIVVIGYFANLLVSVMLTKMISIEHFGLINYAITMLSITSSLILFGTNSSSRRFLNAYLFEHREHKVKDYINWNLNIIFVPLKISYIISLILFFYVDPLELFFIGRITEVTQIVTYLFVASPLIATNQLIAIFLYCDDQIAVSTFLNQIGFYSLMLISLSLIYFLKTATGHHSHQVSLANTLTVMFSCNLVLFFISICTLKIKSPHLYNYIRKFNKNKHVSKESNEWLTSTKRQLLLNVTIQFSGRIDYILLVLFSPTGIQLALYGIATKITSSILLIPTGLFKYVQNRISVDLKSDERKQDFQKLWNNTMKYNVFLTLTLALLIQNCQPFLASVYGPKYLPAMDIIKILNLRYLISSISGSSNALLQFSGHVNKVSYGYGIKVIIFLISSVILYPLYMLNGIAYASLISTIFFQIYIFICVRYFIKIKPFGIF